MLSDRRQRVLRALIEEYVARAMPVGSRTLTERYQLGVSPATVRNELSALEDEGYIFQPHTSAGRIPTDYGYRTFVDSLLEDGVAQQDGEYDETARTLRETASQLDALMEQTSLALARLTDCLSIVLAPSVASLAIKQITLISLNPACVLLVLVTEDGQVLNRNIEFNVAIAADQLALVQRYLNEMLAGRSLAELEAGLRDALALSMSDPLVRAVLDEVVECLRMGAASAAQHHSHRMGIRGLMAQPEFASTQSLMPIMQMLEDDTVLLQILDEAALGGAAGVPSVSIGRENRAEGLEGVSVVASRYGRGPAAGVVAVIGPTRMDYSKVIRAVRAASRALDDE